VRLVAAAFAAALAAALLAVSVFYIVVDVSAVSVVVEVGDNDRVGGTRPRDAVAHRHQNDLHAAVERDEVRLPQDRRQGVAHHRLAHQAAQLFGSVVEPEILLQGKLDYDYNFCLLVVYAELCNIT
jgi:hypothetical protein